ncbi:hypothetical protein HK104_001092 [Borealophlyctis nickersoniae]|nr:hypothetical protein HK104_001092 [Borealophlyctis nickersoniae]
MHSIFKDNLYLDMNGIIHNCSHPNDDDVHFRLSEDQIFLAIFNYIDHLFAKIKPQKLFFLAVDGVAPRAKMNQQRARRFRTAKDAADARKRALQKGEKLPDEPPFDSNCITPGTPFMARLQEQLKYFISKKVSEDGSWRGVEVILSGHEVPGEGEHKIMEYLRLAKSQPDYCPNIRHCLYGLDADLMMLGLLSHEPHFALLREEVTFGPRRKKSPGTNPENQSFYLMHLSLFREYLDAEFAPLKERLPFPYDLERIIDDFILMSFFVGNDFLPNLPHLHINEGALAYMFKVYKKVLPSAGGYLNDGGELNLARCEILLRAIAESEKEVFEVERGDIRWMQGKRNGNGGAEPAKKNQFVMSKQQFALYDQIKSFVLTRTEGARLSFSTNMPARDRKFIIRAANDLGLSHTIDSLGEGKGEHQHHIIIEWDEDDDEEDEESNEARQRVLRRYDGAPIIDEEEVAANLEAEEKRKLDEEFANWKREYYKEKLEIDIDNEQQMGQLVFTYVEGLQWVLYYYYNGVASWEWFYPYHYAPKITDLVNFSNIKLKFDLGRPFLPFEQLMGVLPAASAQHIPLAFRDLMTSPESPIIDFYPLDFECDLNGKKNDWEAVVKIPFIDEKRLIAALKARENLLDKEEKARNSRGHSFIFTFDEQQPHHLKSLSPGKFPDLPRCLCQMRIYHLPTVGEEGFRKGVLAGTFLGIKLLPGFPSMHTIPTTATLGFHGVTVFNMESPNESIVVTLTNRFENMSPEEIARDKIGQRVFIGWPFLIEAMVSALSDEYFRYEIREAGQRRDVVKVPHAPERQDKFFKSIERIESHYSKRFGTLIGPIDMVFHVRPLKGMKLQEDGSLIKDFGGYREEVDVAVQTIVEGAEYEDARYKERPSPPLEEAFPLKSLVFFVGLQAYGLRGEIAQVQENGLDVRLFLVGVLKHTMQKPRDSEVMGSLSFTREIAKEAERTERYSPSWLIAKQLGMSPLALSKVTSSLHVVSKRADQRYNLGLNLKFESKGKKVLGYSRKTDNGWEYSQRAADLLRDFKVNALQLIFSMQKLIPIGRAIMQSKFPDFFAGLERRSKSDFYEDADFYPVEVASDKMVEIRDYLKSIGVKDFEKVSLRTRALTKEYVREIETRIDEIMAKSAKQKPKMVLMKNAPRQAVLKPSHAKHRLSHQTFDLGDRVIYVLDEGIVPSGLSGTVVGMDGDFLDVVFDETFMGANNLDNRCDQQRGMLVHRHTLLNLSNPQPPTGGPVAPTAYPINGPNPRLRTPGNGQPYHQHYGRDRASAPVQQAWNQGPPRVMSRPRQDAREPAVQKEVYSSQSGVKIEVTKRLPVSEQASGPQQPAHSHSVRSDRRTLDKAPAQSLPRQLQRGQNHQAGNQRSGAQGSEGAVIANPRPQRATTNEDVAGEITRDLKNILHIGVQGGATGLEADPHQSYHHSHHPHHPSPQPMTTAVPAQTFHSGVTAAVPMQASQPLHQPQMLNQPADTQDISRHIMAILQSPPQHQNRESYAPYGVAFSATPLNPPSNELAELVKGQGRAPRHKVSRTTLREAGGPSSVAEPQDLPATGEEGEQYAAEDAQEGTQPNGNLPINDSQEITHERADISISYVQEEITTVLIRTLTKDFSHVEVMYMGPSVVKEAATEEAGIAEGLTEEGDGDIIAMAPVIVEVPMLTTPRTVEAFGEGAGGMERAIRVDFNVACGDVFGEDVVATREVT